MSGGTGVKRFIEGQDRGQLILLPECLDDYVGEDNPVRVVVAFIVELDLAALGALRAWLLGQSPDYQDDARSRRHAAASGLIKRSNPLDPDGAVITRGDKKCPVGLRGCGCLLPLRSGRECPWLAAAG